MPTLLRPFYSHASGLENKLMFATNKEREGVRAMKYEKPRIEAASNAVSIVQGGKHGLPMDGFETTTPAAYEADE